MTKLISIVLFLICVIPSYGELIISRIETEDILNVSLTSEGNSPFYAYSDWEKACIFPNEKNQLHLALNTQHVDDRGYRHTLIRILEKGSDKYLGEIEFRYTPGDSYQHKDCFVQVERSSFLFPHAEDIKYRDSNIIISSKEFLQLISMIHTWNPHALSIIQSPAEDILDRCSLLIQFIWSFNPRTDFSPPYLDRLNLIQTIKGLENQRFGMLCGSFSAIFMKLVANFMKDVPVRRILAYECQHPRVYKNIHPNGHAFVELYDGTHWIYLDPYLRLYFRDKLGNPLGAHDLRTMIQEGRYENCVPHHIDTIIPTCEDIFDAFRIPQCLNWFIISNVIN